MVGPRGNGSLDVSMGVVDGPVGVVGALLAVATTPATAGSEEQRGQCRSANDRSHGKSLSCRPGWCRAGRQTVVREKETPAIPAWAVLHSAGGPA